jgi:excisionase family DNA binding protein
MSDETFYTAHEVAERLKLTPATIHRYIRTGTLQATRIGRNYRITEQQLHDFTNPAPKPQRSPRTQRERIARMMRAS